MAYVQCGTATFHAGDGGWHVQTDVTLYVDRSVTPYARRIYVDRIAVWGWNSYIESAHLSTGFFDVIGYVQGQRTYFVNETPAISSTVETIDGTKYRRTAALGYFDLPRAESMASGDYMISLGVVITYKNSSGTYITDTPSVNRYIRYPDYAGITITAPATVTLNAVNAFTCTAVDLTAIYDYKSKQTLTAYGAFGQNYERVSELYTSASDELGRSSAFSTIYWYPSYLAAATGDFVNNQSNYKIYFELTDTASGLDDNRIAYGEITGTIQYNETPPAGSAPSVSVTATEVSGAGLYAEYGRYLVGKSQIRLRAFISSSFGYGSSIVSQTITLNGVSKSSNFTLYPDVDATFYAYAIDNHGASANASLSYQVYDYWNPALPTFAIHRCQQDGTNDDSGAYVKIEWGISVSPLGNQNSKSLTITHPQGTTQPTLSAYDASGVLIVAADIEHSYDIVLLLTDDLGSISQTLTLSTAGAILDILNGGNGIAFGKVAEIPDTFEVTGDWDVILNTGNGHQINLVDALEALATAAGIDIHVPSQGNN